HQAAAVFAVASGGAPVVARIAGGATTAPQAGPIVHVPIVEAGHHTVELQALDGSGAPVGSPARVSVEIDRASPRMRLVVDGSRLLEVAYRAEGARGDVPPGLLRVRTSDRDTLTAAARPFLF